MSDWMSELISIKYRNISMKILILAQPCHDIDTFTRTGSFVPTSRCQWQPVTVDVVVKLVSFAPL